MASISLEALLESLRAWRNRFRTRARLAIRKAASETDLLRIRG